MAHTQRRTTIRVMLRQARLAEGFAIRRTLNDRTTLEITQHADGMVAVKQSGSLVDLAEIMRYWPEPVPDGVHPVTRKENGKWVAVARWPRPAELVPQS